MTDSFTITVRRIGTDEIAHRETYEGESLAAEHRASTVWNCPQFAGCPDRFRLKLHKKGDKRPYMTIG